MQGVQSLCVNKDKTWIAGIVLPKQAVETPDCSSTFSIIFYLVEATVILVLFIQYIISSSRWTAHFPPY